MHIGVKNRYADGTSPLRIQRAAKSPKEYLFEAPGNDVPADPVSPPRRSYPGSVGLDSGVSRVDLDAPVINLTQYVGNHSVMLTYVNKCDIIY